MVIPFLGIGIDDQFEIKNFLFAKGGKIGSSN